jgi:raffinose/stachyose/melibiose transport system permease protein
VGGAHHHRVAHPAAITPGLRQLTSSVPTPRRVRFGRYGIWPTTLALLASLLVILPIGWIVSASFKGRREAAQSPLSLPLSPMPENYVEAWNTARFGELITNSLIISVTTVVVVLILALPAAYAFATFEFRGKRLLFMTLLVGLAIPISLLVVPLFYEILALGLLDTHLALMLPQVAVGFPFAVLVLRAFIEGLPRDILEAGKIDGCGEIRLLTTIVVPLTRPALLAVLVLEFMWTWNQFLLPLILTQTAAARTLPLGMSIFLGRYGVNIPLLMAGAIISSIPIVLVYIVFQRHMVKGITTGAVAGS